MVPPEIYRWLILDRHDKMTVWELLDWFHLLEAFDPKRVCKD